MIITKCPNCQYTITTELKTKIKEIFNECITKGYSFVSTQHIKYELEKRTGISLSRTMVGKYITINTGKNGVHKKISGKNHRVYLLPKLPLDVHKILQ